MGLYDQWVAAREKYEKATGDKKPGGFFESVFGKATDVKTALGKVDTSTTAAELKKNGDTFAKAAVTYIKKLAESEKSEKDTKKKKAIGDLRQELITIGDTIQKLVLDVNEIAKIPLNAALKNPTLFKMLEEYAATEYSSENINYYKDYKKGVLAANIEKAYDKYFKKGASEEINAGGGALSAARAAYTAYTAPREDERFKKRAAGITDEKELASLEEKFKGLVIEKDWKPACEQALHAVEANLSDTYGRFRGYYVTKRLDTVLRG